MIFQRSGMTVSGIVLLRTPLVSLIRGTDCSLFPTPGGQRFNEHLGEERQIQVNEEWPSETPHGQGKGREFKPFQIRPLLSRGAFERLRDTSTDRRTAVSGVRRVTNGVPEGLDEAARKQRIKQLGNSIVPAVVEIIARRILEIENGH